MAKENKIENNINFKKDEVNNNSLNDVAGGAYWYAGKYAGDKKHKWEVIDDETGKVLGRYATKAEAKAEAELKGSSNVRYYKISTINAKRDAWKQHMEHIDSKQQNTGYKNPY